MCSLWVILFIHFRYEPSVADFKSVLEETLTSATGKIQQEERKEKESTSPCNAVTTFLVNEVWFTGQPTFWMKMK